MQLGRLPLCQLSYSRVPVIVPPGGVRRRVADRLSQRRAGAVGTTGSRTASAMYTSRHRPPENRVASTTTARTQSIRISVYAAIPLGVLLFHARSLDLIALGDEAAHHLGAEVDRESSG